MCPIVARFVTRRLQNGESSYEQNEDREDKYGRHHQLPVLLFLRFAPFMNAVQTLSLLFQQRGHAPIRIGSLFFFKGLRLTHLPIQPVHRGLLVVQMQQLENV
jgi:hypothetical protein